MTAPRSTATRILTRVWSLARRAVSYEIDMWRSLFRWLLRRPAGAGPGAATFGYASVVTPIFGVFIGLSAVEIPVLHLILPWPTAQTIAILLGVWGLIWMIGALAMLRTHPHVVDGSGLRLRYGTRVDISIPWSAVAEIRHRRRALPPGRSVRVEPDGATHILYLAMSHQTSVDVALRHPMRFRLPKGESEPVTALRFFADDERALVAEAHRRLPAGQPDPR